MSHEFEFAIYQESIMKFMNSEGVKNMQSNLIIFKIYSSIAPYLSTSYSSPPQPLTECTISAG